MSNFSKEDLSNLISINALEGIHKYEQNIRLLFNIPLNSFNNLIKYKLEIAQNLFHTSYLNNDYDYINYDNLKDSIQEEIFNSIMNYHEKFKNQNLIEYKNIERNSNLKENEDIYKIINNITFNVYNNLEIYYKHELEEFCNNNIGIDR